MVTDLPPVGTEFVVADEPATGNNPSGTRRQREDVTVATNLTKDEFVITLGDGGFVPKGGVCVEVEATFAVVVLQPGRHCRRRSPATS